MPEKQSLAEAERVLKERERETLEDLKRIEESTIAAEFDGSIGRLTRIDAHQQQQVALHGKRQLEFQLACVRNALDRVKQGTYGACLECGGAIAPARLEAAPEAPFCVACQERREREGRA